MVLSLVLIISRVVDSEMLTSGPVSGINNE